jgi:glycosyltransferase involved in cell wall biosynthesis
MTVWFDVEDLIRFFQNTARPTGIQRLSFETYRAIWRQAGASGEVRFCRRSATRHGFKGIHFPALEAGIIASAATAAAPAPQIELLQPNEPSRLAKAAHQLPLQYRIPLGMMARGAKQMAGGVRDLARAGLSPLNSRAATSNRVGGHQFDLDGQDVVFGPGDWVVNLGASWDTQYAPEFLEKLHADGARFSLLAYDLIPELFPEWCHQIVVREFRTWLRDVVPQADLIFTISRNTASDLVNCLQKLGKSVPAPVVLPVGSYPPAKLAFGPRIVERPYVLMVSTIEARKNHAAMLRVWRRMLQTMPESAVPDLVFAGKIGWLTTDLIQQLNNADWLGGKIRFINSPTESNLSSLYRHCLFSVFPSLYEGWGLPVTESLSFGKTVVASRCSAIPDAGGEFCAYFDPDSINDAYSVIRGLIENPDRVATLEARIAATFRPPTWDDTAAALLAQFGLEDQGVWPQATGLQSIHLIPGHKS